MYRLPPPPFSHTHSFPLLGSGGYLNFMQNLQHIACVWGLVFSLINSSHSHPPLHTKARPYFCIVSQSFLWQTFVGIRAHLLANARACARDCLSSDIQPTPQEFVRLVGDSLPPVVASSCRFPPFIRAISCIYYLGTSLLCQVDELCGATVGTLLSGWVRFFTSCFKMSLIYHAMCAQFLARRGVVTHSELGWA